MKIKNMLSVGKVRFKKAAPHIMFACGIAGVIFTIVDSCVKSRTLDETLDEEVTEVDEKKEIVEDLKARREAGEAISDEEFKEAKKALRAARVKFIKKMARVYALDAAVGITSICLLAGSHYILTRDLLFTATALTAVNEQFRDYRAGVREKYGEEVDREIMYERHMTTREMTITNEDGEEETVEVDVADWREGHSVYAMAFCKTYCGDMFVDNQHYDVLSINNMIDMLEKRWQTEPVVYLSEAYKFLCHDQTPESIKAGWVKGYEKGDGTINVEVIPTVFEFIPGQLENGYIIDFNVDGDVSSIMPSPRLKGLKLGKGKAA